MEYTWSVEAYAKVVFHAAQYLTHPLTGLLLGYSSNNSTKIVDSIPLFHTPIVTSSIELALLQVDEYATKHELKIVGMYTAPSTNMNLAADSNITQAVAKVADKIKQFYSDAFIFVVHDTITQSATPAPAGSLYITSTNGSWGTLARQGVEEAPAIPQVLQIAFSLHKHRDLCDFDSSLDDPTKDWTNPSLFPKSKQD